MWSVYHGWEYCIVYHNAALALHVTLCAAIYMTPYIYGTHHRKSEAVFLDIIRNLTTKDITSLVSKMIKSPPSLAIFGDTVNAPRYDAVAARFK